MSDLISRKEALWTFQDRVCHDVACFRCPMTDEDGTCRIDDWLKALPSADRPGEWIRYERGLFFGYKCSRCGGLSEIPTDCCPNCGADMRGEKNG